jgi:hypothetical protein
LWKYFSANFQACWLISSLLLVLKKGKRVKNMSKKLILLGATALVISGFILNPAITEAYRGGPNTQGSNCTGERHEAMEQAFKNNDYNVWKELVSGEGRITQIISEENFARFAEAHRLAEEGRLDEASQIRQELGFGLGNRHGDGLDQGNQGENMGRGWNR